MSHKFTGSFTHSVDDKGRFIMPLDFRNILGGQCKITRGLDKNTIYIYSMEEFENLTERLLNEPTSKKNIRQLHRIIIGGAVTVDLDKQGRCLIPQAYRKYANIESSVIVTGLGNKIELMAAEVYENLNLDEFDIAEAFEDTSINM